MDFTSHSQAGQDRFVWEVTEHLRSGSFFDIGCGDPVKINNSYALEQVGWRGLLVDVAVALNDMHRQRTSRFVLADATTMDWTTVWPYGVVDYLSLDVDWHGLRAAQHLPLDLFKFRVVTMEHDVYRFGEAWQRDMRKVFVDAGYELICANVMYGGNPFEDWWVFPPLVNMQIADGLRSNGAKWDEIFPAGHQLTCRVSEQP